MNILISSAANVWNCIINATTTNYHLNNFGIYGTGGKKVRVDWGDGNFTIITIGQTVVNKTYSAIGNYNIRISGDLKYVDRFDFSSINMTFKIDKVPKWLTWVYFGFISANVTGKIEDFGNKMRNLYLTYVPSVTGNISLLPKTIRNLSLYYSGTSYTGNVADLHRDVETLNFSNVGTSIYMALSDFPSNALTSLTIGTVGNRLTGSFAQIPRSITQLDFYNCGQNLTGTITSLPTALTKCRMGLVGNNYITGNIQDLPVSSVSAEFAGMSQVRGSIESVFNNAPNLTSLNVNNLTGITGEIGNLRDGFTQINIHTLTAHGVTYNVTYPYWVGVMVIQFMNLGWSQVTIDKLLADLVAANYNNGIVYLGGNTVPSSAGLANKAILQSRGWTVNTDV